MKEDYSDFFLREPKTRVEVKLSPDTLQQFMDRINEAFPYEISRPSREETEQGVYWIEDHKGPEGETGKASIISLMLHGHILTMDELEEVIEQYMDEDKRDRMLNATTPLIWKALGQADE